LVAGGGAVATPSTPFIPRRAWPGTLHTYRFCPFFMNRTRSVAVWPGLSGRVRRPAITKSWTTAPAFLTRNVTRAPFGTLRRESVNEKSFATTLMVTALGAAAGASPASPASERASAMPPASASTRTRREAMDDGTPHTF